jgi:ribonuclease P protein component
MALRAERFSRRHRFTAQGSFGPLLRAPGKIRGLHAVIHVARAPQAESRLGIALTRRLIPSAVARNRVKRMLREAFRRHEVKTKGLDCVVTLRHAPHGEDERALAHEVRGFFDQLCARR